MNTKDTPVRRTLVFANRSPAEILLTIGPGSDEVILAPEGSAEVVFEGPADGRVEIEFELGQIVVYGWVGSTMTIRGSRRPGGNTQ